MDDLLTSFSSKAGLEKGLVETKAIVKVDQVQVPSKQMKALGVAWNVERDQFSFNVESCPIVTKRQVLTCVASIYDPLGIISDLILEGRMILQGATRLKLGWDQELPHNLKSCWHEWLSTLMFLEGLATPKASDHFKWW